MKEQIKIIVWAWADLYLKNPTPETLDALSDTIYKTCLQYMQQTKVQRRRWKK